MQLVQSMYKLQLSRYYNIYERSDMSVSENMSINVSITKYQYYISSQYYNNLKNGTNL